METEIRSRARWQGPVLTVLFALATIVAVIFGLRTYHSFSLVRSAYHFGAAGLSSVRAWMTLQYIAGTYQVPETALIQRLGLLSAIDRRTALRSIAQERKITPFQYIQQVQQAISELRRFSPGAAETARAPETLEDEFLAALLVYGYPVLGLTLLLGTMGAPFPSALSVVVAGSLVAQGQMSWFWSGTTTVTCSVLGDLAVPVCWVSAPHRSKTGPC